MAVKYFDCFAGIGGFRSGLELAGGYECVGFCEIDKKAETAYRAINSWDDVEVQYSNGETVKLEEKFESPDHAINVVRRMLHVSGMVLDNTSPAILGHLSKNIRIAVLKTPLVDEDVGVAASIRIVNAQKLKKEDFLRSGTAADEMMELMSALVRYGVSTTVAGATSSGKTTLTGWLLTTIPHDKRIFTIENGKAEQSEKQDK